MKAWDSIKKLFGRLRPAVEAALEAQQAEQNVFVEKTQRQIRDALRRRAVWCANHVGRAFDYSWGFYPSDGSPHPGYFWKEDRTGGRYRLYKARLV